MVFTTPLLILAGCFVGSRGSAFLERTAEDAHSVSAQAVEQTLQAELSLLGRDGHLLELEEQLRPMFAALPKNSEGRLDAPVVRYALHRFFVQTRGWFVQGLQPDGEARDSTAPVKILTDRVPGFIQALLERRVGGRGLELPELAAFAATIQDLVHAEGMQNLLNVFEVLRLPSEGPLSVEQLDTAMELYLISTILGTNLTGAAPGRVEHLRRDIAEVYPAWPDVELWAKDVQHAVFLDRRARLSPFERGALSLEHAAQLMQQFGQHFGAFQDQECRTMKQQLVDMEHRGTGRVRLSEFYRGGLDGHWQFAESVDYLRAIGALDESNPAAPSVVIPNYVGSQSNCLASSSFYSVCCLDECEGLLGRLEAAVGEPSAAPRELAALVAALPSDTVDAPRNLSAPLLARLEDIGEHHGGRVPLHGRLFAQWMHHAYPRECPFPHLAGTTNPMTPDEWMAQNGGAVASEAEMREHVNAAQNASAPHLADELEALPWMHIEELVATHEAGPRPVGSLSGLLSKVLLLGAFAWLVTPPLLRGLPGQPGKDAAESKLPRYLV